MWVSRVTSSNLSELNNEDQGKGISYWIQKILPSCFALGISAQPRWFRAYVHGSNGQFKIFLCQVEEAQDWTDYESIAVAKLTLRICTRLGVVEKKNNKRRTIGYSQLKVALAWVWKAWNRVNFAVRLLPWLHKVARPQRLRVSFWLFVCTLGKLLASSRSEPWITFERISSRPNFAQDYFWSVSDHAQGIPCIESSSGRTMTGHFSHDLATKSKFPIGRSYSETIVSTTQLLLCMCCAAHQSLLYTSWQFGLKR